MNFEKQFGDSIESFNLYVKDELEQILNADILSVEENINSEISDILDQKGSSDLILKYEDDSCVYFASNRVLNLDIANISDYKINITLRNSINGKNEQTEIDKLKNSYDKIIKNIPVVMPKVMCLARVVQINSSNKMLLDIIVVETMPLLEFIFSHKGLNLPVLREKMKNKDKANVIHFDNKNKLHAGIRKNTDNKTTFLYINTDMLDNFNIPYQYKSFKNDIDRQKLLKESKIIYWSRRDAEWEISEMENFVIEMEENNLGKYIEEIFYNTKASFCTFEINKEIELTIEVQENILAIAMKHISQFCIFDDNVHHGEPLMEAMIKEEEELHLT